MNLQVRFAEHELVGMREAARDLYGLIEKLHTGEAERYVLVDRRHAFRAVLLSVEAYAALFGEER